MNLIMNKGQFENVLHKISVVLITLVGLLKEFEKMPGGWEGQVIRKCTQHVCLTMFKLLIGVCRGSDSDTLLQRNGFAFNLGCN